MPKKIFKIFTAVISIIARSWKEPKRLSIVDWINKLCAINKIYYYQRMNFLQPPEAMWINLKLTIEWKKPNTHTQKAHTGWLHLHKVPKWEKYNLVLKVCIMIACEERGPRGASRTLVKYCFLIQVLVTWVCLFCKTHQTVHLICVWTFLYICYTAIKTLLEKGKA